MMIWIGLILLICAGFSAYAGASQLEQAKQRAKCSLDAFTERRNGVSCICLSVLFVILGVPAVKSSDEFAKEKTLPVKNEKGHYIQCYTV